MDPNQRDEGHRRRLDAQFARLTAVWEVQYLDGAGPCDPRWGDWLASPPSWCNDTDALVDALADRAFRTGRPVRAGGYPREGPVRWDRPEWDYVAVAGPARLLVCRRPLDHLPGCQVYAALAALDPVVDGGVLRLNYGDATVLRVDLGELPFERSDDGC